MQYACVGWAVGEASGLLVSVLGVLVGWRCESLVDLVTNKRDNVTTNPGQFTRSFLLTSLRRQGDDVAENGSYYCLKMLD
jgi:hypothetical protein